MTVRGGYFLYGFQINSIQEIKQLMLLGFLKKPSDFDNFYKKKVKKYKLFYKITDEDEYEDEYEDEDEYLEYDYELMYDIYEKFFDNHENFVKTFISNYYFGVRKKLSFKSICSVSSDFKFSIDKSDKEWVDGIVKHKIFFDKKIDYHFIPDDCMCCS